MLARYDARNQAALQSLLSQGVKLAAYSKEIMDAANTATNQLLAEFSANDPEFQTIFDQWAKFRDTVRAWNKINEASFTNFVYGTS
jgi:TRAP-type mannitol/chloroaromatic compound transport system substrate-binding protein